MLAEKIRKYISDNGLKFNAVAERTGISIQTFSAMINGNRKITAEEYFLICKALNVPLDTFAA